MLTGPSQNESKRVSASFKIMLTEAFPRTAANVHFLLISPNRYPQKCARVLDSFTQCLYHRFFSRPTDTNSPLELECGETSQKVFLPMLCDAKPADADHGCEELRRHEASRPRNIRQISKPATAHETWWPPGLMVTPFPYATASSHPARVPWRHLSWAQRERQFCLCSHEYWTPKLLTDH